MTQCTKTGNDKTQGQRAIAPKPSIGSVTLARRRAEGKSLDNVQLPYICMI